MIVLILIYANENQEQNGGRVDRGSSGCRAMDTWRKKLSLLLL